MIGLPFRLLAALLRVIVNLTFWAVLLAVGLALIFSRS